MKTLFESTKREDILIIAIRYCVSRNGESITTQDIATHLSKATGEQYDQNRIVILHIYEQIINIKGGDPVNGSAFGYLKVEAHFSLIEYDAMQSANILARKALNRSNIAIGIAVIAILIEMILGII